MEESSRSPSCYLCEQYHPVGAIFLAKKLDNDALISRVLNYASGEVLFSSFSKLLIALSTGICWLFNESGECIEILLGETEEFTHILDPGTYSALLVGEFCSLE